MTSTDLDGTVDVERLDQVRIVTTLRRIAHADPADAYVVSIHVAPWQSFEERSVLALLAEVPVQLGQQTLWSLRVARSHGGVGPDCSEARAEIRLDLVTPTADAAAALERLAALTQELRGLAPASTRQVTREEAVETACELVTLVWGGGPPGTALGVSDEQHRSEPHGWTFGLVGPDHTRFRVDIGSVAGDPHTAHLRRRPAAEVSDSVGTQG